MTEVIAISKQGKNVGTCTDPNDFIFHSGYNTFKIIAEGTSSFVLSANPSSEQEFTLAHNLDYTPFAFVFCKFPDDRVGNVGDRSSTGDTWFSSFATNGTNLRFFFANSVGTPTIYVKYYVTEVPI